jgi:hypothetical protein
MIDVLAVMDRLLNTARAVAEEVPEAYADAADKTCKDAEDAREAVKELIAASVAFYERPSQIWNADRSRLRRAIMDVKGMDDPTW